MSETPIGDASATDNGLSDVPPAPSPVDVASDPSVPSSPPVDANTGSGAEVPAPVSAPPAEDTPPAATAAESASGPFLVKSLAEEGPVRYGFAIGSRVVAYDVPQPADPVTGAPRSEHVEFTELAVAWFDGEVGGANAETVEPAEFVQG